MLVKLLELLELNKIINDDLIRSENSKFYKVLIMSFLEKKHLTLKVGLMFLIGIALFVILIFYLLKPIPQSPNYHHFADKRSWIGIPNAGNVLSNIVIFLSGIWGVFALVLNNKIQFNDHRERWIWIGVALGLVLTSIGSAYYHLNPNNERLVWDRLPMTIVFMSLVAALISERVNIKLGLWLWPCFITLGFFSVWMWYSSELQNQSDLSFYLGIQSYAFLMTFMMWILPSPYNKNWFLGLSVAFYAMAILCDSYDYQINHIMHGLVSGHTIKHILVGLTGASFIWMILTRKRRS